MNQTVKDQRINFFLNSLKDSENDIQKLTKHITTVYNSNIVLTDDRYKELLALLESTNRRIQTFVDELKKQMTD